MTEKSKKTEQNTEITEAPAVVADKGDDKIGGILKQARLSKGKKIPEVAQTLCIRKAYLEAIEANDYEKIPEAPYGIGFIRSYADYLGLNSSLIIQKYKEETEPKNRRKRKRRLSAGTAGRSCRSKPQIPHNQPAGDYCRLCRMVFL